VRKTILGLSGGLLIFVSWRGYLLANHYSSVADFGIGTESIGQNLSRLSPTLLTLKQNLFDLESWSLLWYGAAAALIVLVTRRNVRSGLYLFLAIAIPLSFDMTVYIFSAWPDYLRHVNLSLSRLILQVAPTAILLVAMAAAAMLPNLTKSSEVLGPVIAPSR